MYCLFLRRRPDTQWAYGKVRIVDENGDEIRQWITRYKNRRMRKFSRAKLLTENWISQMGVFWRQFDWRNRRPLSNRIEVHDGLRFLASPVQKLRPVALLMRTLHAFGGTQPVNPGRIIKAQMKEDLRDSDSQCRRRISGFHLFASPEPLENCDRLLHDAAVSKVTNLSLTHRSLSL